MQRRLVLQGNCLPVRPILAYVTTQFSVHEWSQVAAMTYTEQMAAIVRLQRRRSSKSTSSSSFESRQRSRTSRQGFMYTRSHVYKVSCTRSHAYKVSCIQRRLMHTRSHTCSFPLLHVRTPAGSSQMKSIITTRTSDMLT